MQVTGTQSASYPRSPESCQYVCPRHSLSRRRFVPPHAGCFRDDQIFDTGDLQRDKVSIRRRCDAEVKCDSSSGYHNPVSASRGRLVQRNPAPNSSMISVRASAANTSMQPADHRSPVYSLTAAAPHRIGSGGPNGWRAAACASNSNAATKFRRQGALSIGHCIW
jgi:hypothetical protein